MTYKKERTKRKMMKKIYTDICAGTDVRANLIELKKQLKTQQGQEKFWLVSGNNCDAIMKCLVHEDPKVRKNAAAILGMLHTPDAVDVLVDAWMEEDTRFVREAYITALANLDCEEYLPEFHRKLEELSAYDAPENEKKHVQAEIHALTELLLRKEGLKKHAFVWNQRVNTVVLTTLPAFRDLLAQEISSKKTLLKAGVRTETADLEELLSIRYWQELLFPIKCSTKLPAEPKAMAQTLKESDLMEILTENHAENHPFYFRVGIMGAKTQEEKSETAKRMAAAIEEAFAGQLINSSSHYEVELRLFYDAAGQIRPFLKLYTISDNRFRYRRYHVAASMKPFVAAGLMALAKPYLKEYAQVLDPFCGVGTLLTERRFVAPVRNSYGIDTFGEAIEKARANTKIAGMQANYINRDFFDFVHDYPFDEIITDMPAGNLSREDLDEIYRRFFQKAPEVLTEHGRVICYSKEQGLFKKYLRLHPEFRMLQEFEIMPKGSAYLFILERK